MSEKSSFTKLLLSKEGSGTYSPISDADDFESQASTLDIEPRPSWERRGKFVVLLPWSLVAVLGSLSIFLFATMLHSNTKNCRHPIDGETSLWGTFGSGFNTDFADSKKHIELVKTSFQFGPEFNDEGIMVQPDTEMKRFAGDPRVYGEEIQANWDEIIKYRYIRITAEEAYEAFGDEYKEYWNEEFGGYTTGIEAFHTLHCVYFLWKAYYPEVFYHQGGKFPEIELVHRDHCIEHVRQYIMCHADLSPTPSKFFPGLGRNYVLSNNPHVCRDFGQLRSWMTDRYMGENEVSRYEKDNRTV